MKPKYCALREDGPHATETYTSLKLDDSGMPSRYVTASCFVVYADRKQPSHCVRIFQYEEDQ